MAGYVDKLCRIVYMGVLSRFSLQRVRKLVRI
jgi:hypothetical protein